MRPASFAFSTMPSAIAWTCRSLGAEDPLSGRIGAQLGELVEVDRGRLRADRDRDQVAIPGGELFELSKQLFALGSPCGALDALLRVARRQVELADPRLLELARLGPARLSVRDDRPCGVGRVEQLVEIRRTGLFEQRLAPRTRCGIEHTLETVEPAGGDARQRRPLVVAEMRCARVDELAHHPRDGCHRRLDPLGVVDGVDHDDVGQVARHAQQLRSVLAAVIDHDG